MQFIKFLISGGIAAFLNWSSRFLFSEWMPFEYAVVAAYFVGLTTGFILMRNFAFSAKQGAVFRQISYFIFINLLGLAQTLLISIALLIWTAPLIQDIKNREAFAHLGGVLFPVITSYFGHKFFTFKK